MTNQNVISNSNTQEGNLYYLHRDPEIAKLDLVNTALNDRHFSVKKSFINSTTLAVTIQERIGLSISLPAMPTLDFNNVFIVRLELNFHSVIREQVKRTLSALDERSSSELQVLKKSFIIRAKDQPNGSVTVHLDYILTLDEIKTHGGTIYLKEVDTVISIKPPGQETNHPSNIENYHEVMRNNLSESKTTFNYNVDIIDNNGSIGVKYIRINNSVYKIMPRVDMVMPSGIYCKGNSLVKNNVDDGNVVERIITPEEYCEYGIYNTYDEARTTDYDLARKKELLTAEHDLQLSKNNFNLVKANHDKEMLDKEIALKNLVIENERLLASQKVSKEKAEREQELFMLKVKNNYEEKSYTRKDNSEAMKYLPTIVMGIGATFLALTKFFK